MNEINAEKDKLLSAIEDFKKVQGRDTQALLAASIAYRQNLLLLHESAGKLVHEMKKFGEKEPNSNIYAASFVTFGQIQEQIDKEFYDWTCALWDEFILPMMNCSESDKSDIQSVEKNVKSVLSKLEDQVKKSKKEAKAAKKGQDSPEVLNTMKKVLAKHQIVNRYFQSYKEVRFSFWLRKYYSFIEAQIKYHSRVLDLLTQESVAKAAKTDPTPLPFPNIESDTVNMETDIPVQQISPTPSNEQMTTMRKRKTFLFGKKEKPEVSVSNPAMLRRGGSTSLLKAGVLSKKEKNDWVKFYVVITDEKELLYFKGTSLPQNLETKDGNVPLPEATNLQLNNEKFTFAFNYNSNSYEFQCENREQLDAWNHILNPIFAKQRMSRDSSVDSTTLKKEESKQHVEKSETGDKLDKPDKPDKIEKKEELKSSTKIDLTKSSDNLKTEATKPPITIGARAKDKDELGEWKEAKSDEGEIYYYNEKTGETTWDKPDSFKVEKAEKEKEKEK